MKTSKIVNNIFTTSTKEEKEKIAVFLQKNQAIYSQLTYLVKQEELFKNQEHTEQIITLNRNLGNQIENMGNIIGELRKNASNLDFESSAEYKRITAAFSDVQERIQKVQTGDEQYRNYRGEIENIKSAIYSSIKE